MTVSDNQKWDRLVFYWLSIMYTKINFYLQILFLCAYKYLPQILKLYYDWITKYTSLLVHSKNSKKRTIDFSIHLSVCLSFQCPSVLSQFFCTFILYLDNAFKLQIQTHIQRDITLVLIRILNFFIILELFPLGHKNVSALISTSFDSYGTLKLCTVTDSGFFPCICWYIRFIS